MNWFRNIFKNKGIDEHLLTLQDKYIHFLSLLEKNNQILKIFADMEEKVQGEYLFDMNYVRTNLVTLRTNITAMIDSLIKLGGKKYQVLRGKYKSADNRIEELFPGNQGIKKDRFTLPFSQLTRDHIISVGSKNAQLGELKSLGIQVPDGFAISAWAYKYFIDTHNLQEKIREHIAKVNIKKQDELVQMSQEIQQLIDTCSLPESLNNAIADEVQALKERSHATRFAIRSSALGEDTSLSFAGQYSTYLNVQETNIAAVYKKVLASKFSPKALYYFLSHELHESNLAMSVGCNCMIDSVISGVMYTRDPVNALASHMIINSIFGLGKYLVDGTVTPDVYYLSSKNGSLLRKVVAEKKIKLVRDLDEGVREEEIPVASQNINSLNNTQLEILYALGRKIDTHYKVPQDIEWAIDSTGILYILQTRPLCILEKIKDNDVPDMTGKKILASEGITVCPGTGVGEIFHVNTPTDLVEVPEGAILLAKNSFPGLITVMNKVNAIITKVGGVASHMATIAREYKIPTLTGIDNIDKLPNGITVSVDASKGIIYEGSFTEFQKKKQFDDTFFDDIEPYALLKSILEKVVPLNLIHPTADDFTVENCITFHDITRFAHQKAMEEMFFKAANLSDKNLVGLKLKSSIPLRINIIYLDKEADDYMGEEWVEEQNIESIPMRPFLQGMMKDSWQTENRSVDVKGFISLIGSSSAASRQLEYSENSYAILSKEYMINGLNLGYHFTCVEAMCTDSVNKNFIRMQFKEGGASYDKRIRRIRLISEVLVQMGFENHSHSDYLDTRISGFDSQTLCEKLVLLGRLIILTKQLDICLSNDSITQWYTQDILAKLQLKS